MSNFFRNIAKSMGDTTTIASDGESAAEFSGFIDTGSYALNALLSGSLYGGMPSNKTLGFAAESATGKTFFALSIIKTFLEENPDGGIVYYDTEAAVTKTMMEERGIATDRVVIAEPVTVQEFRTHALNILKKYGEVDESDRPPMLMVLDSLGQLSTTKEIEDSEAGKETRDMTKTQLIKGAFRMLDLKLSRLNVPFIITNHVYDKIGSMYPAKEISGGSGFKYASDTICTMTKAKEKDGTDVIGAIISVTTYKSRLTIENRKIKVRLMYDGGLERYYGLLPIAEKYGIVKKVSTKFEFPDGTKAFEKTIYKNPEKYFTEDIMAQLEVAVGKEFKYGNPDDEETVDVEKLIEENV